MSTVFASTSQSQLSLHSILEYFSREEAENAVRILDGKDLRGQVVGVTLSNVRLQRCCYAVTHQVCSRAVTAVVVVVVDIAATVIAMMIVTTTGMEEAGAVHGLRLADTMSAVVMAAAAGIEVLRTEAVDVLQPTRTTSMTDTIAETVIEVIETETAREAETIITPSECTQRLSLIWLT